MTLPLTSNQEKVWRYIKGCSRSPTYDEMQRDLGIGRSRINAAVLALKERGFVTYIPTRARSLVAIDPSTVLEDVPTAVLAAELARRLAA